jgi:hypothetical protein
MRKFDFAMQTLIMAVGLASAITAIFHRETAVFILIVQVVLGVWQMTGCLLSLIFRGSLFRKKLIHFITASVYLGTFSIIEMNPAYVIWYLTLPAWALGIYYYIISYKGTIGVNRDRGGFLPNLSF